VSPAYMVGGVLCGLAWGYVVYLEVEWRRLDGIAARFARLYATMPGRRDLATVLTDFVSGVSTVPVRVAMGVLVGGLSLLVGANVILALVLGFLGATAPASVRRYLEERTRLTAQRQVPSYLSAVTMAYMTTGSLPTAVQDVARDFPAPLGDWLRLAVARVTNRRAASIGDEMWRLGEENKIHSLWRLATIVRRADEGSPFETTIDSLVSLDREIHQTERQQRDRRVASKQGEMGVQFGSVGLGLFYVLMAVGGDERALTSLFGIVCTAAAVVFVLLAYIAARSGSRAGLVRLGRRRGRRRA